jgi:hypothetical protein
VAARLKFCGHVTAWLTFQQVDPFGEALSLPHDPSIFAAQTWFRCIQCSKQASLLHFLAFTLHCVLCNWHFWNFPSSINETPVSAHLFWKTAETSKNFGLFQALFFGWD